MPLLDLRSLLEGATYQLSASGASTSSGSGDISTMLAIGGAGASTSTGSGALNFAYAIAASGASTSTGSGAIATLLAIAGVGSSSSSGAGALAMLMAIAATGASSSSGSGDLAIVHVQAIAASGASSSSGSGVLVLFLSIRASGGGRSSGAGDLVIFSLGPGGLLVALVAVAVPRTNGSYGIVAPVTGLQTFYEVSGGIVKVAPNDLARFLRKVPGSQVLDPVEAEYWRTAKPYVPELVAGPFGGG